MIGDKLFLIKDIKKKRYLNSKAKPFFTETNKDSRR